MKKNKSRRVQLSKEQLLERMRVIQQFKLESVDKSLQNTNKLVSRILVFEIFGIVNA